MIIEIPIKPISVNKWNLWHWTKKGKVKKEFEQLTYYLSRGIKVELPIKEEFIFVVTDNRRHDIDNFAINCKLINDGLQLAKVIPDDSYREIESITLKVEKGSEDKIILKI